MFSTPSMSNRGVRIRRRTSEPQCDLLQLETDHRDLEHAGRDVEVERRPPTRRGDQHHPGIGVDHDRMTDGSEHGRVVDAVGVGVALGEIDVVSVGPLGDGGELAR